MKSKELREWYQSGISLYDIEILMMYDLNDSDLRGYFTLIRDNGVSVNDIDYILRHDEIGPSFQRQLLQALSTDKNQFESSLCWLEEKGILDTSKDCREDTPEEEEEIDLKALTQNIRETDKAIKEGNELLLDMLKDLTFSNNETKEAVEEFMKVLEEV